MGNDNENSRLPHASPVEAIREEAEDGEELFLWKGSHLWNR